MATEAKKPASPPGAAAEAAKNKRNLFIGATCLALGGAWFIWDAFLRPLTKEEIKARQDEANAEMLEKKEEERRERRKKGLQ